MIKKFSFFLFSIFSTLCFSQQLVQERANITFFSNAPIEDIFSESKQCISTLNGDKKLFSFEMKITSFSFKNPLMKEHFNDNYLESKKFPVGSFKGNILGDFDLSKDGVYKVFVTGKLLIHGVAKQRKIPGKIIVRNGKVNIEANLGSYL